MRYDKFTTKFQQALAEAQSLALDAYANGTTTSMIRNFHNNSRDFMEVRQAWTFPLAPDGVGIPRRQSMPLHRLHRLGLAAVATTLLPGPVMAAEIGRAHV